MPDSKFAVYANQYNCFVLGEDNLESRNAANRFATEKYGLGEIKILEYFSAEAPPEYPEESVPGKWLI